MYTGLHIQYPLFLPGFKQTLNRPEHISEKNLKNTKFRVNHFISSRIVPSGRTALKKLLVTFRNFTEAPKTVNSLVTALAISNLTYFNSKLGGFDPVIEKNSV